MTKIFEKENRGVLLNTLLIVILILTFLLTSASFAVQGFEDRVIGNNALENVSLPALAHHFYLSYLFLFPVLLFLTYKLLKKGYSFLNQDFQNFNQAISIFGLISYFFSFLSPHTFSSFLLPIIFTGITFISIFLNKIFRNSKSFHSNFYTWTILLSIPVAIIGTFIMHRLPFFRFSPYIHFIGLYFLSIIIMTVLFKNCNWHRLTKSSTFFLSSLIIHPLFIELYNILNQYHIFIPHKGICLILIYFILFLVSVFSYRHMKENKDFNYKKYYYPIIILGFSLIYATNPLINFINTDFFEAANHGVSIFEFLKFGKIPLIETFDAHMFTHQFLGILYGIINHDIHGAIFNIYDTYQTVLFFILLYFLIQKLIGQDEAFLSIIALPFLNDTALFSYYFVIICIFTFLKAVKQKNFLSYLIFFLSLALSCIYRLDIGFAISISACLLLLYLVILDHKNYPIKKIITSFVCVVGIFLFLYLTLCLLKNINPITRALEFLKLSLSNSNWAYSIIGNGYSYAYFIFYYVVPVLTILSLLYLLITKKRNLDTPSFVLILLALFYLFNFQRGIIRHSLAENTISCISGLAILYFSLFIYYCNQNKTGIFSISYSIILVFFSLLINLNYENYYSLVNLTFNKELSYQLEDEASTKKENRIVLSDWMKNEYQDLKSVLALLLKQNETYLDFSNQTLLYSLLGYEKPVYVNQSPGLLSGEYTQQLFLDEIKNFKHVPIALKAKDKKLSNSLDGVANDYRYYLISEYIYQNYSFLTDVNGYEIWIEKERYESAKQILKKNHIPIIKEESEQEIVNLQYIPYIWGQENKKVEKQIKLKKEEKEKQIASVLSVEKLDKTNGNYLILTIENKQDLKDIRLKLKSNHTVQSIVKFYIPKGTYTYKIRISTLNSWYFDDINQIELEKLEGVTLKHWSLAEGDTLQ